MNKPYIGRMTTAIAVAFALGGCAATSGTDVATAQLKPTAGHAASGTVQFVQRGAQLELRGEVRGLKPDAQHGFHVHEKGDCSSADALSAGGHFNPAGSPHGHRGHGSHHAGDLPNLKADAGGVARFAFQLDGLTVSDGANSVAQRALVVHRDADDHKSQPAGNAGPRIACAVIVRG